jgi:hypothetical protein
MRERPRFKAFDEVWKSLRPREREEAELLLLRYLDLVRSIHLKKRDQEREVRENQKGTDARRSNFAARLR